jgi:hypothetical protein
MNYNDELGWFFYSEKQNEVRRKQKLSRVFCKIWDTGKTVEYTEWSSGSIKPSGIWNDYVKLGRGIVVRSERRW